MARLRKNESEALEDLEGMTAKLGNVRALLDIVRTRVSSVRGPEMQVMQPALQDLERAESLIISVQRQLVSRQ
jgi:hypothetical protein